MTHKDIYTKFMIEYDKAGASTSYPSLTEYEVATVLDKAYNALIAQKVTGNNVRRATFESDIKSIADLGPLVKTQSIVGEYDYSIAPNLYKFDIEKYKVISYQWYYCHASQTTNTWELDPVEEGPHSQEDIYTFKHYITIEDTYNDTWHWVNGGIFADNSEIGWSEEDGRFCAVSGNKYSDTTSDVEVQNQISQMNGLIDDAHPFYFRQLIETEIDTKLLYFLLGSMLYNGPKNFGTSTKDKYFTSFVTDQEKNVNYNPIDGLSTGRGVPVKLVNHEMAQKFFTSASNIPWIKQPVCFIEGKNLFVVYDPLNPPTNEFRMTYIKQPNTFVKDLSKYEGTVSYFDDQDQGITDYEFECNSTVAEELVSLAIAFALENVESQRLNSKLNMRGLEA